MCSISVSNLLGEEEGEGNQPDLQLLEVMEFYHKEYLLITVFRPSRKCFPGFLYNIQKFLKSDEPDAAHH